MLLIQKPYAQSLFFLGLTLVVLLIVRPKTADSVWTISGIIYFLFIVCNSVIIWKQEGAWTYFSFSLLLSVLYLLAIQLINSAVINLFKSTGSGESSMIFLVIIYHPMMLLLVMGVKWLYFKIF